MVVQVIVSEPVQFKGSTFSQSDPVGNVIVQLLSFGTVILNVEDPPVSIPSLLVLSEYVVTSGVGSGISVFFSESEQEANANTDDNNINLIFFIIHVF